MTTTHNRRSYAKHRRVAQAIADGHNQLRKLATALPDLSLDQIRASAYYLVRYGHTEVLTRKNNLGAATYGLAQPLHVILDALRDQDREFDDCALNAAWGQKPVPVANARYVELGIAP